MIDQASLIVGDGNWAVKSDSLLGYKIINKKHYPREMSVTRATTATRVNEDGLIEETPYNLLTYSEQFENGVWTKFNVTASTNSLIAPDGTLTAENISVSSTTNDLRQDVSVSQNTQYTFSFYAKKDTISAPQYRVINMTAVTDIIPRTSYGSVLILNEWVRVTLTFTTPIGCSLVRVQLLANTNTSGNIGFWGAQLVQGSAPKDYLPTTDRLDIARIDYSTGEAALLVEPQRTNSSLYSEQFDNAAYWTKVSTTITDNNGIAPDGTMSADTVTLTTTFGRVQRSVTLTASTQFTASTFVKNIDAANPKVSLLCFNNANTLCSAHFTLTGNGSVSNEVDAVGSITPFGNGWYRCSITFNSETGATSPTLRVINNVSTDGGWTIGESVFLWGAQLEAGAYPTSYIPTTSASVTRNADVISKTGIADLIGQSEGTLFADVKVSANKESVRVLQISDGTIGNRIQLAFNGNNFTPAVVNGGVTQAVFPTPFTAGRNKLAIAYANNDVVAYLNGIQIGSDSLATIPLCNLIDVGHGLGSSFFNNEINFISLFKTRLTNTQLATLTTI